MIMGGIIILFILYRIIKNTGKDRKMTIKGLIIVPALLLWSVAQSLQGFGPVTIFDDVIFFGAIAIGGIVGMIRSRFYSYKVEGEQLFYKKNMTDTIILLAFIVGEEIIRFVFKSYESNFFMLVNVALLMLAITSIITRRTMMFIDSRKLTHVKPII